MMIGKPYVSHLDRRLDSKQAQWKDVHIACPLPRGAGRTWQHEIGLHSRLRCLVNCKINEIYRAAAEGQVGEQCH